MSKQLINVEMPDGTIIEGVPEGVTQGEVMRRYAKMKGTPSVAPAKGFGDAAGNYTKEMGPLGIAGNQALNVLEGLGIDPSGLGATAKKIGGGIKASYNEGAAGAGGFGALAGIGNVVKDVASGIVKAPVNAVQDLLSGNAEQAARGAGEFAASVPTTAAAGKAVKAVAKRGLLPPSMVNRWMGVEAKQVAHGANPAKQLLKEKLLASSKKATRSNVEAALTDAGKQLEAQLKAGTAAGVQIDGGTIVQDALSGAQSKLKTTTDAAFSTRINTALDKITKRFPDIDKLTPERAHALKVELGDNINWTSTVDDPLNDAFITAYRGLNESIGKNVKGIGPIQQRWGNLYQATKTLKKGIDKDIVGKGTGSLAGAAIKRTAPLLKGAGIAAGAYGATKLID